MRSVYFLLVLFFSSVSGFAQLLTSSNLPIVQITTQGLPINDTAKVTAVFTVIDNPGGARNNLADPPTYTGYMGIETRGASSLIFPQKSYSFEIRNVAGVQLDTALFGMPAEHDFVLYAPYNDKTLMRNVLMYQLSRDAGRYAARTHYCEVVLDGQYVGLYVWTEKIKRDKNRVAIGKMSSASLFGDKVTGGYILQIDLPDNGFASKYAPCPAPGTQQIFVNYVYPKSSDIALAVEQSQYIQAYIDSFETAVFGADFANATTGFRRFANDSAFIDHAILNEFARNPDGYRLSAYLYKDRYSNGGRLCAGPIWDFNSALGNANYYDGVKPNGWVLDQPDCSQTGALAPGWWKRLQQDPVYRQDYKCRYTALRANTLSSAHVEHLIDSLAAAVNEAKDRHFAKWPVLGTYIYPNAYYPPTYGEETDSLRKWANARLGWLDTQLLDATCPGYVPNATAQALPSTVFTLSPNPLASGQPLLLTYEAHTRASMTVHDATGAIRYAQAIDASSGTGQMQLSLPALAAGMYLVQFATEHAVVARKMAVY